VFGLLPLRGKVLFLWPTGVTWSPVATFSSGRLLAPLIKRRRFLEPSAPYGPQAPRPPSPSSCEAGDLPQNLGGSESSA
jgi:hypothetical protein